jgi:hypothetical protein
MSPLTIVIVIIFLILLYFFLRYLFSSPNTLQTIQNGRTSSDIPATSLSTTGTGSEDTNFAYSIWYYINDWNYRYGEVKTLFARMGGPDGTQPCPAVQFDAVENNVTVTLSCFPGEGSAESASATTVDHACKVGNIPIQRWTNLLVSVYGRSMDIYIDGKLVRTCLLPGVANVNSDSAIFVTPDGGFDGWTSQFQYFPTAINPQEAWNIYSAGYSGGLSNWFSNYQLQVAILENGNEKSSFTI